MTPITSISTPESVAGTGTEAASSRGPILPTGLFQLSGGYQAAKTFLSAVELGVFDALGPGPLTGDELRERVGIHRRAAGDFFDALVALDLLDKDGAGYHNTPETARFLDSRRPTFLGNFFTMTGIRLFGVWANLTTALRTGLPQSEADDGKEFFTALYADPERLRLFVEAMDASAPFMGRALAERFEFGEHRDFVDVGGARGGVAAQIVRAHPHLRAGCFDLPAVEPIFDEHMAGLDLGSRIGFHAGDFFADPLPECDIAVLGHVLHDWDEEDKRALLRSAFQAIRAGGAVLVYDPMLDEERRANVFGLLSSLNMLLETHGGFEYTFSQCRTWMEDAGFVRVERRPLIGPDTLAIGRKPA